MAETRTLDSGEAWRLVSTLAPDPTAPEPRFLGRGPDGEPRIVVDGTGRWSASESFTPEARNVLDIFLPLRVRPSFVIGQLGQSLDGRIATESGHSHYINGPDDIRRLHRLRALVDAVVIGAGTAEADDPRLTVREVEGADPARVVLDPRGRVRPDRRLFERPGPDVLWLRGPEVDVAAPSGVATEELPVGEAGGFDPRAVVAALARRGWHRLLIEGGGVTVSRFLDAGALDRLHVSVAPLILGSGRPSFTLPVIETLDEALRPAVRHFHLGTDLLFDLELVP